MRFYKKKKVLLNKSSIKDIKKVPFSRYFYFFEFKKINKRYLLELKKKRYIQVGLLLKKKIKLSKNYLYKTLHFIIKNKNKNKDYFNIFNGIKNIKDDFIFTYKNKNKVFKIYDKFYSNQILLRKQLLPIFLTKFQYNLYDKNYKIYRFYNFIKLRKQNLWYLQGFYYGDLNYLYFTNLYNNLINNICFKLNIVLLNYYIYKSKYYVNKFNLVEKVKYRNLDIYIDHYIKFKNQINIRDLKILNKYLIRARMFRAGKFFYNYLQYMKRFTYSAYKNNLFYRKIKYMKFHGAKCNTKLISLNIDKFAKLKGWFYIYNYVKKNSYLVCTGHANQHKMISYFINQYYYLYCFVIKFFYKILYNLKFMFINKFSYKKILFLKIVLFYMYHLKMFKYRRFSRIIRKRKFKKWRLKRVLKFRNLWYIRFLLRIKTRTLNRKFLSRIKLGALIKKRKRRNYFKFKNRLKIVNWLIKFRRLKGFKNPFRKPFKRFMKYRGFKKHFSGKQSLKINKFKQLSNNNMSKKQFVKKKPYVKRF